MATFTDTIRFVVEAATGQAERSLGDVRKALNETEGSGGRIRAGFSAMGETIRSNLVPAVAAGASAVGAFLLNAADQYADTAREAGQLADVTRLTTEESSRWLAVMKQWNVEGADLADVLNNINAKAAEGALAKFGIDAQDSNERLIQTIEYIGSLQDETKRAQVAAELLGEEGARQFGSLAASAETLRDRLRDVSDLQVITDEERDKAAQYDEAVRKLSNQWRDFSLSVAPAVIDALTDVAGAIQDIRDGVNALPTPPQWFRNLLGKSLIDWAKDFVAVLPGGSGEMARSGEDVLFGPGGIFGPPAGGKGPGTPPPIYPPAPTIGTQIINMPPGVEGPEVDRNLASWFRYNGTGDWGSSP